ncbi:MAG: ABC transporter ATP-binding protein [Nitrososphaerales archaeon]
MSSDVLLNVEDLRTYFFLSQGVLKAVDGVNLLVHRGEALGLVGESGCGKSVAALSIIGLLPIGAKIVSGKIIFEGEDLTKKSKEELRRLRGSKIAMVFQDPMTSLNPVFTVGEQLAEVFKIHKGLGEKEALAKAVELLDMVRVPDPSESVKRYPHQFSGGMRQRVMIAMALACRPTLLIADEPTTALDVTVQAQILDLFKRLIKELNTSTILISHDLGVVAELCDTVAIQYAGRIVERAPLRNLLDKPLHPYTQGLLDSLPKLTKEEEKLKPIPGSIPNPIEYPSGCKFHPRCKYVFERCVAEEPLDLEVEANHFVRCWLY